MNATSSNLRILTLHALTQSRTANNLAPWAVSSACISTQHESRRCMGQGFFPSSSLPKLRWRSCALSGTPEEWGKCEICARLWVVSLQRRCCSHCSRCIPWFSTPVNALHLVSQGFTYSHRLSMSVHAVLLHRSFNFLQSMFQFHRITWKYMNTSDRVSSVRLFFTLLTTAATRIMQKCIMHKHRSFHTLFWQCIMKTCQLETYMISEWSHSTCAALLYSRTKECCSAAPALSGIVSEVCLTNRRHHSAVWSTNSVLQTHGWSLQTTSGSNEHPGHALLNGWVSSKIREHNFSQDWQAHKQCSQRCCSLLHHHYMLWIFEIGNLPSALTWQEWYQWRLASYRLWVWSHHSISVFLMVEVTTWPAAKCQSANHIKVPKTSYLNSLLQAEHNIEWLPHSVGTLRAVKQTSIWWH